MSILPVNEAQRTLQGLIDSVIQGSKETNSFWPHTITDPSFVSRSV